jgi:hypothetical protein
VPTAGSGAWAAPARASSGLAKLLKVSRLPACRCVYFVEDVSGNLSMWADDARHQGAASRCSRSPTGWRSSVSGSLNFDTTPVDR